MHVIRIRRVERVWITVREEEQEEEQEKDLFGGGAGAGGEKDGGGGAEEGWSRWWLWGCLCTAKLYLLYEAYIGDMIHV